jgi:hypothetical protein
VPGPAPLDALVRRSADPVRVERVLDRLSPARVERIGADGELARAVVAVAAASGWLGRLLAADGAALDVLATLDQPVPDDGAEIADGRTLGRWWRREQLRIAARDLTDRDPLETTMSLLTRAAARVLDHALRLAGAPELAVVALGKAGGTELNYASTSAPAGGTAPWSARSTGTGPTGSGGPSRGSARPCSRPGPSPATPTSAPPSPRPPPRCCGTRRSGPTTSTPCGP